MSGEQTTSPTEAPIASGTFWIFALAALLVTTCALIAVRMSFEAMIDPPLPSPVSSDRNERTIALTLLSPLVTTAAVFLANAYL